MLYTHLNDNTIALNNTPPPNATRRLAQGRAWQVSDKTGLSLDNFVDLSQVAGKLMQLGDLVNKQFVDRAEMIQAAILALASGEHCFIVGPPGTAKTKVIECLAQGVGGTFGARQISADTTADELFGPIDAIEFSNGVYTRRWSGIAQADVFYINEIWEASSTVTNIFKTALESRIVADGDIQRSIPLLSAIADSNHCPTDKAQQADWDRFLLRLSVGYIKDASQFRQMLTIDAGSLSIPALVSTDEIRLFSAAAELMAMNPPSGLIDATVDLWREIGQNGRALSDRRFRKTIKAACANALLGNETPEPHHLAIGRWTLWNEVDEMQDISNLVLSKCAPVIGEVLNFEAILSDLVGASQSVDPGDGMAIFDIIKKCKRLENETAALLQNGANGHANRLKAVAAQAKEVRNKFLED